MKKIAKCCMCGKRFHKEKGKYGWVLFLRFKNPLVFVCPKCMNSGGCRGALIELDERILGKEVMKRINKKKGNS